MKSIDKPLLITIGLITIFGLAMMSSISISESFKISGKPWFYWLRHFIYILVSVPVLIGAMRFPYELLRKISPLLFLLCITLLILVLLIGDDYGTAAKSWLKLGPLPSFQPVEIVKLATIIFLATIFSSGKNNAQTFYGGFLPFFVVLTVPSVLIIAQPDFGSLLVLVIISASIYFTAGADLRHFFGGAAVAFLSAVVVASTTPYIMHRVRVFLDPSLDPLNTGFQIKQALIAVGSGGLWGRGFQHSIQKYDYLPEVQSDAIFAAISEEMGYFRILILIGAYLFIAYRGFLIARNAPDQFTKLLAVGITTWVVGQAFINIGVNLALLPNTGITLPLLSYGGTSIVTTFAALGILLHISGNVKAPNRKRYF